MTNHSKPTILIVDDERELAEVLGAEFEDEGFEVSFAASGNEALQRFESTPTEFVLTDVRMENGTGVDLLETLQSSAAPAPYVFLMSGFADISVAEGYDLGACGLFTKPLDKDQNLIPRIKALRVPVDERWAQPFTHADVAAPVSLRASGLRQILAEGGLAVGKGGVFLALENGLPQNQAPVHVTIEFEGGPVPRIDAYGVVRWVRPYGMGDAEAGIGVEICSAVPETTEALTALIQEIQPDAFIPITGQTAHFPKVG